MRWTDDAACKGTPITWWFPTDNHGNARPDHVPAQAAARCDTCPVRRACARHAVTHEEWGVWAAMSEDDRRQLRNNADVTRRNVNPTVPERARTMAHAGQPADHIATEVGITKRNAYRYLDEAGHGTPPDDWRRTPRGAA